ncbi:MAG: PAS domain S-box protein [Candidatus Binatia bacterium]
MGVVAHKHSQRLTPAGYAAPPAPQSAIPAATARAYLIATATAVAATALTIALHEVLGGRIIIALFLMAVAASAYYGGVWAAGLAMVLSLAGIGYLVIFTHEPPNLDRAGVVTLTLFVVASFPITLVAARQTRAERERAVVEAALRDNAARVRAMFDAAADGILTIDEGGIIESVNPATERLFGYAANELIGRDVQTLMPVPFRQSDADPLDASPRQGETRIVADDREVLGLRRDGTTFPVDLSVSELRVDRRRHFIGILRDISERRQSEEARDAALRSERQARAEAEAANRAKDEFLAIVSHELRTPLTPILTWAHLLRSGRLDQDVTRRACDAIERAVRSQAQLIEDLLDVSRITSGQLRLEARPIELAPVVEAALESVRPAAEAKEIALDILLDHNAGMILGDATRLQQVIWNLLANAIKFTPKGGRVQSLLRRVDSHIEFRVSDTGQGIGPHLLPHVFERFRQADSSTTRAHRGLGLGLAIVRHLVELHGGVVRAESPGEGRGTTFVVELPLLAKQRPVLGDREPQLSGAARLSEGMPTLQDVRVLVVDDEPDTLETLRTVLEHAGADVRTAASTRAALAVLQDFEPDVLLSDIGMPGEDGFALIQQIRTAARAPGRQIPAVALTAYARREDQLKVLAAGFQMHLPKPVTPAELLTAIASLGRRAASGRPNAG